jgi:antitoxin (DNA-binding transcriptional repressor) of toxin-antitoxin stability system
LLLISLVADIVDRTDAGEEVQDLAIHGAHVADLMPVSARDHKDMSDRHLDGGPIW